MGQFKRNQVEDAISKVILEIGHKPSSDLQTRLKRLLNLDRGLGRKPAAADPVENAYAFYSADAPGKGTEVLFSEYESFALLMGVRLLEGQWPQGFVVETLRRTRTELEREHRRILRLDREELFDKALIRAKANTSSYAGTNSAPAFLLVVSDSGTRDRTPSVPYSKIYQDPIEALRFQLKEAGRSCTWCELVTPAWSLHDHLGATVPRQRGRSS